MAAWRFIYLLMLNFSSCVEKYYMNERSERVK